MCIRFALAVGSQFPAVATHSGRIESEPANSAAKVQAQTTTGMAMSSRVAKAATALAGGLGAAALARGRSTVAVKPAMDHQDAVSARNEDAARLLQHARAVIAAAQFGVLCTNRTAPAARGAGGGAPNCRAVAPVAPTAGFAAIALATNPRTRKVEEIAFYNSLETENKKAALRERLAEAERRRAAAAEAKEAAAKAAAEAAGKAEERRASDEQLKRQTLEDRVREKELRREKERREREATRAEQERRRLEEAESKSQRRIEKALDAKASEDARRDELRARLLAADSRRREYLTAVRERAVGKEERAGAGEGEERASAAGVGGGTAGGVEVRRRERTVVRHQRVVRLDLIRALDERRELAHGALDASAADCDL